MTEFEDKVIKLLETINSKLDSLLGQGTSAPVGSSEVKVIPTTAARPSEIVERQEEAETMKEKPPVEGRVVCPECGGTSFKEQEDKSQVLHQMGGMKIYKKLKICKSCGFTFD